MMFMLRDDLVIELFDSPLTPPKWIEAIDIENQEYQFCDDTGQRYVGEIVKPVGLLRLGEWRLRPEGEPNIQNLVALIQKANGIISTERFPDLESLKKHATSDSTAAKQSRGCGREDRAQC